MINIAEILKDYPSGTKLYSPICGECELECVVPYYYCGGHEIRCVAERNCNVNFDEFGRYGFDSGECLLFPSKENRDWTNFGEPKYLEPDSSVVETVKQSIEECEKSMKAPIALKKGDFVVSDLNSIGIVNYQRHGSDIDCFVIMRNNEPLLIKTRPEYICNMIFSRFATEEEKQKLLTAIDENGYIWDFDKLELRKQEHKFQPFEKVLVRDYDCDEWGIDIFSNKTDNGQFQCIGNMWRQCVPYESNEHLFGTTNNL